MAAPRGNKFWKARSKHGRDKIFATPQIMMDAAYEYFEWNSNNPWYKKEAIKSGENVGKLIDIPIERPLTLEGLCNFWDVNTVYFQQFEKSLKANDSQDFSKVLTHIRDVIYRQKYEGGAIGTYNANIIARDLGLRESVNTQQQQLGKDGEPIDPIDRPYTKDDIVSILKALNE